MTKHIAEYQTKKAYEPKRTPVDLRVGNLVSCGDQVYRLSEILDFGSVIGVEVHSGRSVPLRIGELRALDDQETQISVDQDIDEITSDDWKIAEKRYEAIKPIVEFDSPGRKRVTQRAKEIGVHPSTLYRWLGAFQSFGVISALIPRRRGWKEGNGRISVAAEEVVQQTIKDFYLTPQRPSAQETVVEVRRRCREVGVNAPSASTIRSRISKITEKERLRGRGYREKAKNKFIPTPGTFPHADYPLAVVQIDHTPVDLNIVDDEFRRPIDRVWLTLAIDVYSRMVTGYHLSLDSPSGTSVAMCVAHSMLPKEEWLTLHGVDADWPVWGKPRTIHVDNGPDFKSDNFKKSCAMHSINLDYRPVKVPRYGAHIERLLGTFMKHVHGLPGTTFSSVHHKAEYDSEKHAAMTKSELEKWLVVLICKYYHQKMHNGIGMSPSRKWEIGIFGNAEETGIGMRPRPSDRLSIQLDFLPSFKRTIQTFGVTIDGLKYYSESLRPWINYKDPKKKTKRKFVFRRDPRDISNVWFYDPDLKQYFRIPFANLSLPPMSFYEYQQAQKKLKAEGEKSVNEHRLLDAVNELREMVEVSKEKTKKARRQAQRRKEHEKKITPATPFKKTASKPSKSKTNNSFVDGDIDGFGDIA
ncbi:Mu transposase C-terminal domain-containing protein [Pseudodesulfovibrio piezophilus]|uniref:Integrase catalytic region n=1 Tax=Pseudodesulfovibrio piezophilus (strain DSM 21447 / JCM 15486 / C1TLV30) TaxID=1322246 RepID=M1WT80_PSEP2|nr:Mu transposase C-terminal domain-containing protein [Pseudodesulfovibrio piezophilus]CCH49332.1 Integrase catalytic region [Pseudodesulfovibrio piezophilus C1TLV30]